MNRIGIMLLDGTEIIIRMYEINTNGKVKLLHSENRDLTPFDKGNILKPVDIIEIIAEISIKGFSFAITDWKICARNTLGNLIKEIMLATNTQIELLTLNREQEILCNGLIIESGFF